MKIFISGGCKNGKSTYALKMASAMAGADQKRALYYVATMRAGDDEDLQRIRRHRHNRQGMGFVTVEQERDIIQILDSCDRSGTFLIDSTTALLANEMFSRDGGCREDAGEKVADELRILISDLENIVFVSDYIYADVAFCDETTREYCKSLAAIDRVCAKYCDIVIEAAYGKFCVHKGGENIGSDFWRSISGKV